MPQPTNAEILAVVEQSQSSLAALLVGQRKILDGQADLARSLATVTAMQGSEHKRSLEIIRRLDRIEQHLGLVPIE